MVRRILKGTKINMVKLTKQTKYIVAFAKSSWTSRFKKEAIILLILVCVVIISWLPRLRGPIDIIWDGSVYYILGTSLAEGKGYRLLNEPGEIEAIQYPPLLPLIVAAHQKLLGTSDFLVVGPWLRIFYFFLSVCFTLSAYFLARLYLLPKLALMATLVCTFYFFVYYLSDALYADIPFALATSLFVLLGLHRITGINFRTPMFFNVLVVGALAMAMILIAKRLRGGRIRYTDAFFPLILLNWGQAENLIWGWQLQFYASMSLSAIALLFIVQSEPRLRLGNTMLLGICLVLLPLCGANGLVLVPPVALWLSYSALLHWRTVRQVPNEMPC